MNEMSHWHFVHDVGMCGNLMRRLIAKKLHIIACELHRIYDIVYDKGVHCNRYNLSNSIQSYINTMSCKCMLQMENPVAMDNSFDEWIILGEITIKRTKVLIDDQFFYLPYLLWNCITYKLKWYKYTIFYIMFIYSWSYHPMNLKSFHCVMKVFLNMQRTCWHVPKTSIKYERAFCRV